MNTISGGVCAPKGFRASGIFCGLHGGAGGALAQIVKEGGYAAPTASGTLP